MVKWNPKGKHCYVTGGSSGLGLELARLLVKDGAHVSIVARDQKKLDEAVRLLEEARADDKQILKAYSYSLFDPAASAQAITDACVPHGGRNPDAFFLCAGAAHPGFYVEETPQSLKRGFDNGFWVQAYSAHEAAKRLAKAKAASSGSKIVLVGSIISFFGMVGYANYAPAKHALRGLAETLRSELQLYSVDVQIYYPPTIYTPGYETENLTKPKITRQIEERDDGVTPEVAARAMLQGVKRGEMFVTGDFIGNVFRTSTRGASLWNNVFVDAVYECIGMFALADWRRGVDKRIRAHRAEHEAYLQSKGFYDQ